MEIRLDPVKASERDALFRLLQYSLFEESAISAYTNGRFQWLPEERYFVFRYDG